jgi:hypothetical protein
MTGAQIDGLIRGNTVYQRLATGSPVGVGEVAFYYADTGRAAARMPDGSVRTGLWQIEGNCYRVDWDGGRQNSRSMLTKEDGSVHVRDAADGKLRTTITKVLPGNVEGL